MGFVWHDISPILGIISWRATLLMERSPWTLIKSWHCIYGDNNGELGPGPNVNIPASFVCESKEKTNRRRDYTVFTDRNDVLQDTRLRGIHRLHCVKTLSAGPNWLKRRNTQWPYWPFQFDEKSEKNLLGDCVVEPTNETAMILLGLQTPNLH